jgi:hypothetical protein
MADNVAITAGSGTNIKTDQMPDNTHVQFIKLMDGTSDGTGQIAGDAANGLDADVTRSDVTRATPTAYNLTLTNADTEYHQDLSAHCRGFEFQCRTETTIRFAFVTDVVHDSASPYMTLKAGDWYSSPDLHIVGASILYFASATAGVVMEIIEWV